MSNFNRLALQKWATCCNFLKVRYPDCLETGRLWEMSTHKLWYFFTIFLSLLNDFKVFPHSAASLTAKKSCSFRLWCRRQTVLFRVRLLLRFVLGSGKEDPRGVTWSQGSLMSDPLTRTRKISDLASRARCDLSAPPGNVAVKLKQITARLIP